MLETKKVLKVRNVAQKVLFLNEIAGQISDGQWENARPYEHYTYWMLSFDEIEVVGDSDNVGRNFYAIKSNYNLNNSELLDCIGDRMAAIVRLAMVNEESVMSLLKRDYSIPETYADYKRYVEYAEAGEKYYVKVLSDLTEAGLVENDYVEADRIQYRVEVELRKDLAELKKAMKTVYAPKVAPVAPIVPVTKSAKPVVRVAATPSARFTNNTPVAKTRIFRGATIMWAGNGLYTWDRSARKYIFLANYEDVKFHAQLGADIIWVTLLDTDVE